MNLLKNMINPDLYREDSAINQSYLKTLVHGYKKQKDEDDEDLKYKEHFALGSVLDMLMNPNVTFTDYYMVEDIDTTNSLYPVYSFLAWTNDIPWDNIEDDLKLEALIKTNTYIKTKWTDETKLKKLEEYKDIFDALQRAYLEQKNIISVDNYTRCLNMKESIETNPYYLEFMKNIDFSYYQVFLKTERKVTSKKGVFTFPIKGLLDMVHVDNKNKIIYIVDLKTTRTYYNFSKSVLKFRYDIQMAYYYDLLIDNLSPEYSDYKIEVRFLVVETTEPHIACWYNVSDRVLDTGRFGSMIDNTVYKGYTTLLLDYHEYVKSDFTSLPMDIVKNNGVLDLNFW